MSDDDGDDEISITLNYHGIQKKIDFNFDFDVLLEEAFERFEIDKTKYELSFYYYDKEKEKKSIDKNTDETTYHDIYNKSNKNLMIYVKEEEKKDIKKMESNNNYSTSNVSLDFDDPRKKSESNSFYQEIDDRASEQKVDSKTEENKEVNNNLLPKANFEKKNNFPNMSGIGMSNTFKKKRLDNIENLKKIRNKNIEISRIKEKLDSKNIELKKNIKDIKELIKSKINQEPYDVEENNDDKDLLIKLQIEKTKLENLEKKKLKEIEQIKAKNSSIQNMISTLSIKVEKQKEENISFNLSAENSMKSFPELKDDNIEGMKSLKFDETAISQNGSFFFSNIIDIHQYIGKNGNNKEKKMKRIEKINKLYQKNKKSKIKIDDVKEKNIKNEEDIFNSKVFEKQKLKKMSIKKPKEQNEIKKSIKIENEELKDDIKESDDKIFKLEKEIEDIKRLYEDEKKKIQEEDD